MRKIFKRLFSVPEGERSELSIIMWWEFRRIPFNLIVGGVGFISLLFYFLFISMSGKLKPGDDAIEPFALFLAPVAVNFCYTAGWIVELFVIVFSPERENTIGLLLFKSGLVFSLVVVSLPSAVWGIFVLLQTLGVVQ